jgi:GNAT superfamily N-acetyltransferase
MISSHATYEFDDSLARIDFARVHHWLANTYWSPGISRERVEKGARHSSLVIGAYQSNVQVGFGRVVSDRTRFAYLCDVFVDPAHRGHGLAKAIVRFALDHPEHSGIDKWFLRTQDAHDVYRPLGFSQIIDPEAWMVYVPSKK